MPGRRADHIPQALRESTRRACVFPGTSRGRRMPPGTIDAETPARHRRWPRRRLPRPGTRDATRERRRAMGAPPHERARSVAPRAIRARADRWPNRVGPFPAGGSGRSGVSRNAARFASKADLSSEVPRSCSAMCATRSTATSISRRCSQGMPCPGSCAASRATRACASIVVSLKTGDLALELGAQGNGPRAGGNCDRNSAQNVGDARPDRAAQPGQLRLRPLRQQHAMDQCSNASGEDDHE